MKKYPPFYQRSKMRREAEMRAAEAFVKRVARISGKAFAEELNHLVKKAVRKHAESEHE